MSRIGKQPIPIPDKVQVTIDGTEVTVKGPKGELSHKFPVDMTIKEQDDQIIVTRPTDQRHHRALHGMTRALIANMVTGVSAGLRARADHRRRRIPRRDGRQHPGDAPGIFAPRPGRTAGRREFVVEERGRLIRIRGIDKQVVGQLAANIRKLRPPEPYKGKGVRYEGERIRRKAGKAGKVG